MRRDAGVGELVGEGGGDRGQRALGRSVGDLTRHRTEPLAGGEQHDAPTRAPVMAGGELLGEQDRRSGIDRPVPVEDPRVQRAERTIGVAAGVVAHQHVEVPEQAHRGIDDLGRSIRLDQIGGEVTGERARRAQPVEHRLDPARIRTPRLPGVVGHVVVHHHVGPVPEQPPGGGVADAGAAAHAGDQRAPAGKRTGIARFRHAPDHVRCPAPLSTAYCASLLCRLDARY